ncbi:hypothetical protein HU200_014142 [Digitaria exilis]|uniref:Dirigent protein n=1 Tax=Digitaria exilis TaxID=1010633 RepID=A0A835KJ26_9POAL|nr:hypothetical protein HU200_039425 [Digitaria exilis]KAF8737428.1 hypothetical protein HU200_014142 [Digitaria exilis]
MAPVSFLLTAFAVVLALFAASASAEKETHLRFYFHDVMSGPSPTVVRVAEASTTNASATSFGAVYAMDDPLTEGPDLNTSRLVGRAQGVYVCDGRDSLSLLMAMNFVFLDGSGYNGSSVAVVGPNIAGVPVREMPVVGGTGAFRFARGYCQAQTYSYDVKTGDAIVEYNVYLRHP